MLDLARVNPNGLTYSGMHLFGYVGVAYQVPQNPRPAKARRVILKTLNGGESVHRLISPHYPLVGRTLFFAVKIPRS
ncbi:hypothetical protein C486_13767 [Natrinema gari JCM 14663]|uniref:Uncharacterized protein n=1 Tax=Natrinema gari JCM 14663 TaxID=1230459 RepID=L9YYE9_9EURY|nr:hypothetical protein C486_13767 [Natrinema gari JCM 14663]